TPIQKDAIPPACRGRDVLACAMTGSGKTAAFLLPILNRLIGQPRGRTRALVLAPTRELAAQIDEHRRELARFTLIGGAALRGGGARPSAPRPGPPSPPLPTPPPPPRGPGSRGSAGGRWGAARGPPPPPRGGGGAPPPRGAPTPPFPGGGGGGHPPPP